MIKNDSRDSANYYRSISDCILSTNFKAKFGIINTVSFASDWERIKGHILRREVEELKACTGLYRRFSLVSLISMLEECGLVNG